MDTKGSFYTTYRSANSSFSADTFECAEATVSALLETNTSSDHPGMLLGKVQSGKTRTFISVLALAFDNGFDIAVVLSKNSKALIRQTANRLSEEFDMFVKDGELEVYDIMSAPKTFNKHELDSNKLIFVAKKQDDNLRHLIDLFSRHPAMAAKRTIIVDDEADNASVGYSKKGELKLAKTIAGQISELRSSIVNASFLQVTATPYSLYLQPTEIEVDNVLEFKPMRPAFTKLVPVPQEYVGGETYFGEAARGAKDTVQSLLHYAVAHDELPRLKKHDGRSFKLHEVLTTTKIEGYRTAIVSFVVGGCIQRILGVASGQKAKKLRYSFLLHSESGREAHEWQEDLTNRLISELAGAASNDVGLFNSLVTTSYSDLKKSIELDGGAAPTLHDVIDSVREALTSEFITVIKVNSDEDVAALLDSTGQLKLRTPLNIFLGGQVLDRGVTLANLIGFYYGRRPNRYQQDTVLQHSRMYGYRRRDLAVTRFYTSRPIRYAMAQMEEFDSSLRGAVEAGGDRAVQFIRKAANGSIVPCSPNKILVSTTQTLRPYKRILPIGFQSGFKGGASGISKAIGKIDAELRSLSAFDGDVVSIPVDAAINLLRMVKPTLEFLDDDDSEFDWDAAEAALIHLSQQHAVQSERGKVLLWAAEGRRSARLAGEGSHAKYIETPDSERTEGRIAKSEAIDSPILFMLRQEGEVEKGWRGTPFYWPVIRAQRNTPTAIYTGEVIK